MTLILAALLSAPINAGETISFKKDIRPIFSNRCARCHTTDSVLPNILEEEIAVERRHAIKSKLESKKMPFYGKLKQSEKELVIKWVHQLNAQENIYE